MNPAAGLLADARRQAADLGSWPALIEALLDAVWLVDAESLCLLRGNAAAAALLQLPLDSLPGRPVQTLVATPEDQQFWSEAAGRRGEPLLSDSLLRRADGSLLPVTRRITHVQAGGPAGLYLVALHDLTPQRRVEDERDTLVGELRATLESTADGILVTDLGGTVRAFNRRFVSLWGLPETLLGERNDAALRLWMQRSVTDGSAYAERLAAIEDAPLLQASDTLTLLSGRVLERITLPQLSRGRPIGRVWSFRDLSESIAARRRIDQLSHTDVLTGLPNRLLLASRFEHALALARRDGLPFATLVVDIDRFKHLNDTFGQAFGDRVLVEVAARLQACVRQVDTVARLSGDVFVLLVHGAGARGAEGSARRLIEAMLRPFTLDGMSFTVTCSIGIALHAHDGRSMDELVKNASAAMHRVKEAGRAGYRLHQPRQGDTDLRARIRIDHAMRQGLERGDFRLHYQPQIDLHSGALVGAEALLRWTDATLGEMAPGDFIAVAEESGFIVRLGDWVLERAVRQAADWAGRGLLVPVSVNVSALQFQQHGFVQRVAAVLRAARLPAERLELELTESILLVDAGEALGRLRALAELGVRLAIDDFGTGYSSLAYLKRFPIRRLKIDRSFVRGLPGDESDEGIARSIIQLGGALKLQVVAEGVETEAQRAFLAAAGCHHYQGFLHAPALPSDEFERRLRG